MLLCLGLVAGAERLKPISWNVWAGNIEKEGGGGNPFLGLEERAGFLDIRVCVEGFQFDVQTLLMLYRRSEQSSPVGSERMARLLRVETVDFDTSYAEGHYPHSASLHFLLLVMLREAH